MRDKGAQDLDRRITIRLRPSDFQRLADLAGNRQPDRSSQKSVSAYLRAVIEAHLEAPHV